MTQRIRTNSQNRGYARELAGDLESAERIYREGWDALGAIGERGFRSTIGTLLAHVLFELGRRERGGGDPGRGRGDQRRRTTG